MDLEKQERLQRELFEGETMEWSGEPRPGAVFTAWDIFLIPFSLIWCGFAVFWETMAFTQGAPIFLWIFGLPFVFIGLFLVFGRFILKYCQSKGTVYAVTSRRILVLRRNTITAADLKNVPFVQMTERRNGSGSLDFEPSRRNLWG